VVMMLARLPAGSRAVGRPFPPIGCSCSPPFWRADYFGPTLL